MASCDLEWWPPITTAAKRLSASVSPDAVMLRWSEIEAMKSAGTFEFHSHTHSHTRWDREIIDPANRAERLSDDLGIPEGAASRASRHLCWPQGYYDEAYVGVAVATGLITFIRPIPESIRQPAIRTISGGSLPKHARELGAQPHRASTPDRCSVGFIPACTELWKRRAAYW